MKNIRLLKYVFLILLVVTKYSKSFAQECAVDMETLKGTYTGECKKGKANGRGKAVGTDTYEGFFKTGLPDGEGVYTWNNGNTYEGHFSKGKKSGNGILTYKFIDRRDSVIEGFWKDDVYLRRFEKDYKVIFKSKKVTSVSINNDKKGPNQITIRISSSTAGGASMRGQLPKPNITNMSILKGGYINTYSNDSYASKSEVVFTQSWYPFQAQLAIGNESVEIELLESGTYVIQIELND